jgi:hypothetical protein
VERIEIVADDVGVSLVKDGERRSPAFAWNDVTEIRTFKRDLYIVDDIRLAFHIRDGWFEFSEDQPGFEALDRKMREVFPEVPPGWFWDVAQPPFATNERELSRAPGARQGPHGDEPVRES